MTIGDGEVDDAVGCRFQRARLASSGCEPRGYFGALWRCQFWILGHAAATMLWVNHGPCLKAIGGSRAEFYQEVRRELRRFIVSLTPRTSAYAVRRSPDPLAEISATTYQTIP